MTREPAGERHVDVGDGLRLHASLGGSGPPLVLLHGFTGSAQTWAAVRPALERRYCVIAFDLPGHGQSSAPDDPGRYALDRFAGDLARGLGELGFGRVALLGYSMGGRAALRFAQHAPDFVSALILVSTSSGIRDEGKRRERLESDADLAGAIERDGVAAFVDRWERLPLWESQQAMSAEWRAGLRRQRLSNDPAGLANCLRGAGAGTDGGSVNLSKILTPSLILAGALDPAYVEHGRVLEAELPDARLEVIPDAGHAVHLERPGEFVAAAIEFLGTTDN